jgi:hypothetical protein
VQRGIVVGQVFVARLDFELVSCGVWRQLLFPVNDNHNSR